MEVQDYFDVLNNFVSVLIPDKTVQVTGLGFLQFFIIFLFIFSIVFTGLAYVPAFKDLKLRNARMLIALSTAYFGTTTFYASITQWLEVLGFIAALAIGIGGVILATVPKDKRTNSAQPVMLFGLGAAILIVMYAVFGNAIFQPLVDAANFVINQSAEMIILEIFVAVLAAVIIGVFIGSHKGKSLTP